MTFWTILSSTELMIASMGVGYAVGTTKIDENSYAKGKRDAEAIFEFSLLDVDKDCARQMLAIWSPNETPDDKANGQ